MDEGIIQAIFDALDEVNEHLPEHRKIEKSSQTPLTGDSSGLDSLTIVSLIVTIEQRIEEKYDVLINLVDAEALSQEENPFQDVGKLAEHIYSLMGAAKP
jgi:acyl carrier protein